MTGHRRQARASHVGQVDNRPLTSADGIRGDRLTAKISRFQKRVTNLPYFLVAVALGLTAPWFAQPAAGDDAKSPAAVSQLIDTAIGKRLTEKKLTPVGRARDERLMRRLYLDCLGRIPTFDEAQAFHDDAGADRVSRLIDRLLAHDELPVYWRRVVDGWFNPPGERQGRPAGYDEFLGWLQRSLAARKPWDRLARELLLPQGAEADQKGAGYFLSSRLQGDKSQQLDNLATGVASALFGVQLQCAKCHDHPFVGEWKQEHYYGLGAVFNGLQSKFENGHFVITEKPGGDVKFSTRDRTERTASPMFFDGTVLEVRAKSNGSAAERKPAGETPDAVTSRRQRLIAHALTVESPFFKRAITNRVWKQLLGRGLVEPVDQMHAANPASHPELLDGLADDFARHGFDLQRLIAGILRSETYQRDSAQPAAIRPADDLYAQAILRPLNGEQMAHTLPLAAGHFEGVKGKFAKELKPVPEAGAINASLRVRWEREPEFDLIAEKFRPSGETFQANATQALFSTFSPFALKLLQPTGGTLVSRLASEQEPDRRIALAFVSVLSRPPTPDEAASARQHFDTATDLKQACADLVWALVTSAEFRFNH